MIWSGFLTAVLVKNIFTNTLLTKGRERNRAHGRARAIYQVFAFWQTLNNNDVWKWPLVIRFANSLLKDLWGKTYIKYLKTPFKFIDSPTLLNGLEAWQCQPKLFMVANINSLRPWHRTRAEGPPFPVSSTWTKRESRSLWALRWRWHPSTAPQPPPPLFTLS